jgi:hypothetical protein
MKLSKDDKRRIEKWLKRKDKSEGCPFYKKNSQGCGICGFLFRKVMKTKTERFKNIKKKYYSMHAYSTYPFEDCPCETYTQSHVINVFKKAIKGE